MAGALDSASFLYPLIGVGDIAFYSSIITIKLFIFTFLSSNIRNAIRFLPFVTLVIFCTTISSIANQSNAIEPFKIFSVCLSIALTLAIIRDNLADYATGMAFSGYAICISYLLMVQSGAVQITGTRYHFFEDQHPNLGGEMVLATLIMSALSLRPKTFVPLFSLSIYCAYLWQSRTSILAICISGVCYFIARAKARFGWRSTLWGIWATVALLFAIGNAIAVAQPETVQGILSFVFDSVFLVEDQYRGGESGLSGRDAHWLEAMRVFVEHPFVGAGPNFMERLAVPQPHNWVLYALSQFGILGFVLTGVFAAAALTAVRKDPIRLLAIVPFFIPWLLNDRFLNFNVYPFALYIIVFAPFKGTQLHVQTRTRRPKPRRQYSMSPHRPFIR